MHIHRVEISLVVIATADPARRQEESTSLARAADREITIQVARISSSVKNRSRLRRLNSISTASMKKDARTLLNGYLAAGHDYKANVNRAWLTKLFKWAAKNDYVEASIAAANKLDPAEGTYVKLLILLAPRKTSLASITRQDLNADCTQWTVPFDMTKSRKTSDEERVYLIPLPSLARRLFKGLINDKMPGRSAVPRPARLHDEGQPARVQ
jgi:hypothetical protein